MGKEGEYIPRLGETELDSAYDALYHLYAPYIHQGSTKDHGYIPDFRNTPLSQIPTSQDLEGITRWVNATMRYIPENIFTDPDLVPTSHLHVKALLANVHQRQEESEPKLTKEDYIQRLLISCTLVPKGYSLGGTEYGNDTTDILERFFSKRELTHRKFAHLLMGLLIQTVPSLPGDRKQFIKGKKLSDWHVRQAIARGKHRFSDVVPSLFWEDRPIVFFHSVNANPVSTTETIDRKTKWYNSGSAAGLHLPPDPYVLRSMNVHSSLGGRLVGGGYDPTARTAAVVVLHEKMHEMLDYRGTIDPDPVPETDVDYLLFELVTDSAAVIMLMDNYSDPNGLEQTQQVQVGYANLRLLARELIQQGIFSNEEIVYYGSHQLWLQFYKALCVRLKAIAPSYFDPIVECLIKTTLIGGNNHMDIHKFSEELHSNPDHFLQTKLQEQVDRVYRKVPHNPFWQENELVKLLSGQETTVSPRFVAMADDFFRSYVADVSGINWKYALYIDPRFVDGFRMGYIQKKRSAISMGEIYGMKSGFETMFADVDPEYMDLIAASAHYYAESLFSVIRRRLEKFIASAAPSYHITEDDVMVVCEEVIPAWYKDMKKGFPTIRKFIKDFSHRLYRFVEQYEYTSSKLENTEREDAIIAQRALTKLVFFAKVTDQHQIKAKL